MAEGTEGLVSVDKFSGGSRVYFLTHLHEDHTSGLGAEGGWRHGPLYCSPVTARLLPTRFPGIDTSLLYPISPGEDTFISIYLPISGRTITIQVNAIPALHCPGSLMYLFRGDLGCRLYTGDFRWELGCEEARSAKKVLLDALAGESVDVLYMDNTYCHPSLKFPPRHVVAEQIVDFIRAHPDHEVVIGVATLGKEDLLLHISRALQTKIWVWPQRLLTLHLLGIDVNQEIFTTQTSLTRVRAVPRYSLAIENLEALNTVCPTIGIMASGIPWLWRISEGKAKSIGKSSLGYKGQGSGVGTREMDYDPLSPPKVFEKDCYALPYSDHACFPELEDFMKTVRPSAVAGIVRKSYNYLDPRHHFGHLCGDEMSEGTALIKIIQERVVDPDSGGAADGDIPLPMSWKADSQPTLGYFSPNVSSPSASSFPIHGHRFGTSAAAGTLSPLTPADRGLFNKYADNIQSAYKRKHSVVRDTPEDRRTVRTKINGNPRNIKKFKQVEVVRHRPGGDQKNNESTFFKQYPTKELKNGFPLKVEPLSDLIPFEQKMMDLSHQKHKDAACDDSGSVSKLMFMEDIYATPSLQMGSQSKLQNGSKNRRRKQPNSRRATPKISEPPGMGTRKQSNSPRTTPKISESSPAMGTHRKISDATVKAETDSLEQTMPVWTDKRDPDYVPEKRPGGGRPRKRKKDKPTCHVTMSLA